MLFEKAARLKLRFDMNKGRLTPEDLWDLPLEDLDSIAIKLHETLRSKAMSFIATKDELLQLKFDLVKRVIDERLREIEESKSLAERRLKKEQLLEVLARKQNSELESKNVKYD